MNFLEKDDINSRINSLKEIPVEECLVVTSKTWGFACPHFVHTMEYFYYAADIIVNAKSFVILIEPPVSYKSKYVEDFLKMMFEKFDNFIFINEFKFNDGSFISQNALNLSDETSIFVFEHDKYKIKDKYFIHKDNNFTEKEGDYYNWFPNQKSNLIRDLFIKEKNNNTDIKIGLVNRKNSSGRVLENHKELCEKIYEKLGVQVCITYFEDKTFEEQINFFNKYDIIISPHGAQLCSIPFMGNEGLIIECVDTWHPYYFFSGISYTSNKYHAVISDNHDSFPDYGNNNKSNMKTNIDKVIKVIEMYMKKELLKKISYLF